MNYPKDDFFTGGKKQDILHILVGSNFSKDLTREFERSQSSSIILFLVKVIYLSFLHTQNRLIKATKVNWHSNYYQLHIFS